MRVRAGRMGFLALGLAMVTLMLGTAIPAASAASVPSKFDAQYQRNAQVETQLLAQAQAAGGSATAVAAYSQTVQAVETQVYALYASEQALVSIRTNIPSGTQGQRSQLQVQLRTLRRNLANAKVEIRRDRKDRNRVKVRGLELQLKSWTAELRQVTFDIGHPGTVTGSWRSHPLAGGLSALQESILDLQRAAIHYTQLWIAAAKAPAASTTGNAAAIAGLAYAAPSIAIPAQGAAVATDQVAVMPTVEDAQGNVLKDAGTFSIAGPSGATGVAIDAASGLVSVEPGATAGTYAVTYLQGGIAETVDLAVGQ